MERVQPRPVGENLNIWRLSFRKICSSFKDLRFSIETPLISSRTLIDRILTQYNESREYGRFQKVIQHAWENKGGFTQVELQLYQANYPHQFHYGPELIALGADPKAFESSYKHYLFFLYGTVSKIKRVALFAFTTGQAYNVFKNFTDFQFPNQIARALLVSKNVKDTRDRWTVGPVLASHSWYKEGASYEDNPNALEKIYITFRAIINPSADLISEVSAISKETMVKITRGSICFHKRVVPIDEFPTLIAHLSCVVEGRETGLKDGTLPPPDNFSWLDYLVPVEEVEKIVACRGEAGRLIWSALQNPHTPRSFTFCPKYFFDYRLSADVTCRVRKNGTLMNLGEWKYPPTTQEIIDCICESKVDIKEKDVSSIELCFRRNHGIEHESLVSCFDGELFLHGQKIFRTYGLWYKPNAEYLEQVQRSLNRIVREHLIPIGGAVHLALPWQKGTPLTTEDLEPFEIKLKELAKQKGRYLDASGTILCRKLFAPFFGRSATFKQFHASIQELLNDEARFTLTIEDLTQLGIIEKHATKLISEMQTLKNVLDHKSRVVIPHYEGISLELASFLEMRTDHHEEGHFNAAFHGREGFLVGDTATPVGIELFDLLRIVDGRLYLFHVKEGLDGDHVRAVCSQIRNGARKLKASISGNSDLLDQFCHYIYNVGKPICYRLRKEYPLEADFRQMFKGWFSLPRDQIFFVCAFLDTHSPQRILQEGPEYVDGSDKKEVISSTVAKLELIAVEQTVRSCGFGFKLCQIERSGDGVFSPSVAPPMAVPFQEIREFDLSEYQYEATLVTRQETIGDGDCSFHSALGSPEGGVFSYDEKTKRQQFFNLLTTPENTWTYDALEKKYHSTIRGLLGKLIRDELDASDRLFFEGAVIDGKPIFDFIQEEVKLIFAGKATPNALLNLLDSDGRKRFKTYKGFFNWLKTGTNGAEFLTNLGIPKLKEIGNSAALGSTYNKKKECCLQLANKLETACWNRWRQTILNQDYYLSDDELAMIGYVYNRSIVLIQQGADRTVMVHEICDVNPEQRVFIYGDGHHYERCLPS